MNRDDVIARDARSHVRRVIVVADLADELSLDPALADMMVHAVSAGSIRAILRGHRDAGADALTASAAAIATMKLAAEDLAATGRVAAARRSRAAAEHELEGAHPLNPEGLTDAPHYE